MIHYIGGYYKLESGKKRNSSPACVTKMHYIASKLSEISREGIRVFSPILSVEKNAKYTPSEEYQILNHVIVHEIATIGRINILFKILGYIFSYVQFAWYLFAEIKKGDLVVIYHGLIYNSEIRLFRKLKSNKVIIEVEELYSAAFGMSDVDSEIKYLSKFDGYLYVNDIMNSKFGFKKPYAVCYGNYDISPNYRERSDFHKLIYAGVLGQEGSDVDLAIKIMDYLPDDYSLKIAGYGSDEEISYVLKSIMGKKNITFEGCLSGKNYEFFLNDGDIGLCTRVLSNQKSDYTFPSKVLVYLTHGLIPLCPALDCLTKSEVSDSLLFYKSADPQSVALTLMNMKGTKNVLEKMQKLDGSFSESLRKLLIDCHYTL